jgi:hypothetical protein
MKDIIEKITSYNLFNYLLPGVLFAYITKYFIGYDYTQKDLIISAFIYYFFGMIISRIGSIIIGPFLKWLKFVQFEEYGKFIDASQKDSKIELLSEVNNTYRTLCALFISILILKGYSLLNMSDNISWILAIIFVSIMFLFAYRKQTKFITERIKKHT